VKEQGVAPAALATPLPPKSLLAPAASFSPFPSSRCPPQDRPLTTHLSPPVRFFSRTKKTGLPAFLDHTFPEISTLSPFPSSPPSPLLHSLFPDLPPSSSFEPLLCFLPCRHRLPSASPTCRSLIHLVPINRPNRFGCLRPVHQPTWDNLNPTEHLGHPRLLQWLWDRTTGTAADEDKDRGTAGEKNTREGRKRSRTRILANTPFFSLPSPSLSTSCFGIRTAQPPQRNIRTHATTA
jgi:hypothetical protein